MSTWDGESSPTAGDVFGVIGDACDYGRCSAPRRVRAVFVFGELGLCRHHWMEAEELIVASSSFLHCYDYSLEGIAFSDAS